LRLVVTEIRRLPYALLFKAKNLMFSNKPVPKIRGNMKLVVFIKILNENKYSIVERVEIL
jgi:hypothetical protein